MITDDQTTWPICVFHNGPIAPFWISRKAMHSVNGSQWACDKCIQSRHPKPSEAPVARPRAEQAGMELLEVEI